MPLIDDIRQKLGEQECCRGCVLLAQLLERRLAARDAALPPAPAPAPAPAPEAT
jgi:hypothetical protein